MVSRPYSGNTSRSAHYEMRPAPAGVNADHTHPNPEPDPFNPVPDVPPGQEGTILTQAEPYHGNGLNQPSLAAEPVTHWFDGQPAVPSGVPYGTAQQALQERLMVDHSVAHYVPDSIRLYQHATEGQVNDFVIGRASQYAGSTLDGPLAGLANGHNAYDQTQAPNEVYGGDAANVGRYRLGVKTNVFGLYENPIGKFGQEAQMRAVTGLTPALPYDKPPMANTAPYTPNSTGTRSWLPATPYQVPSMFALPSETVMTDYNAATNDGSDFVDDRGMF